MWLPNGTKVEAEDQLHLLEHLCPSKHDLSGEANGREARVMFLWFLHPAIDPRSVCRFSLTDSTGQPIPPFSGSVSTGSTAPKPFIENNGWFLCSFAPAHGVTLPAAVNMTLEYSLGDWTYPDISGSARRNDRSQ